MEKIHPEELLRMPDRHERLDRMIAESKCACCGQGPLTVILPRAEGCSAQYRCEPCDFSTGEAVRAPELSADELDRKKQELRAMGVNI